MSLWKKIRWLGEACFLVLGFLLIPLLPRCCVVGLAKLLGAGGYRFSRSLRKVALANLDIAFGESVDSARKQTIVRTSFYTFALVTLDLFWFSRFSERRIKRYIELDDSCYGNYLGHEGAHIGIAAHLGNWELLGQVGSLMGEPIISVAAPLKNRFADVVLNKLRGMTGQLIQPTQGALRELIKILKGGGRIALVMDQNTRPDRGGLFVELFGLPVAVSKAAAFLATRTGAPLSMAYCVPIEKGRYRITVRPLFDLAGATIEDGTARVIKEIENVIREYPERWLWMYKRWKHIPDDDNGERYPYYARESRERRKQQGEGKSNIEHRSED